MDILTSVTPSSLLDEYKKSINRESYGQKKKPWYLVKEISYSGAKLRSASSLSIMFKK